MAELKELLNEINEKKLKLYYNLNELINITNMSIRALKYRMISVKDKYKDIPSLLKKEHNVWKIHYSIIREFEHKYNRKIKPSVFNDWRSIATLNPKHNYDLKYHEHIISQVKKKLPQNVLSYTIEKDGRGVNHSHIICDAETKALSKAVSSTVSNYIENPLEYRLQVEPIRNKYAAVIYMKKAPISSGVLKN